MDVNHGMSVLDQLFFHGSFYWIQCTTCFLLDLIMPIIKKLKCHSISTFLKVFKND